MLNAKPAVARVALLCAILALVTGSGASGAPPDEASVESSLPPLVTGDVAITAPHGLVQAVDVAGRSAPTEMPVESVNVTIVHVRVTVVTSPLGDHAFSPSTTREEVAFGSAFARFTPAAGAHLIVRDDPTGHAALAADVGEVRDSPAGLAEAAVTFEHRSAAASEAFYHATSGESPLALGGEESLGAGRLRVRLAGDLEAFATGGAVEFRSARGASEWHLGAWSETLAPSTRVDHYDFALLHAHGASFALDAASGARVSAAFDEPRLETNGTMLFRDATGTVRVAGRDVALAHEELRLDGHLVLAYGERKAEGPLPLLHYIVTREYDVTGAFDAVRVGSLLVFARDLAAVAAGTTLLVALLAALTPTGRSILGRFAAFFYTRLAPGEALSHEARRMLLAELERRPGLHVRELGRACGLSWGRLDYHLNVLTSAGLVTLEREGGRLRARPVGARPTASGLLTGRGAAADVLAEVERAGMVSQRDVAQALGTSTQLAGHHLRALEQDGLVVAVPGKPRRYARAGRSVDERSEEKARLRV